MADEIEKQEKQLKKLIEQIKALKEQTQIKIDIEGLTESTVTSERLEALYGAIKQNIAETASISDEELKTKIKLLTTVRQIVDVSEELKKIDSATSLSLQKNTDLLEQKLLYVKEEEDRAKSILKSTLGLDNNYFNIKEKWKEITLLSKANLSQEEARLALTETITQKLSSWGQSLFNASLAFEEASRNLMRAGNFTFEEASSGLTNVTQAAAIAGVGIDKAAESMLSLKNNFTGFTTLTQAEQQSVTAFTATMDTLGISAETTGKFFDLATKSLGLTVTQAKNYASTLRGFATQNGITMAQINKDLAASSDQISKFGADGLRVFKEMSVVSKQLGVEMNTLFQITEKFTTFEGAADAAGKLNAILGGDFVNSIDLLTASMEDPAEAFKILKSSMDQSGKSFADMDNGMKRVIASSIGMSVQEAGKLFSQDINTATAAMREQAKTQEQLAELSSKLTPLTQKFTNALLMLAPALDPIIELLGQVGDMLTWVLSGVSSLAKEFPLLIQALAVLATVLVTATAGVAALGLAILPLIKTFMAYKQLVSLAKRETLANAFALDKEAIATKGAAAAKKEAISTTQASGVAAKTAAGGMLKLGAAILMIGAGIGIAALGLSVLVSSFKDLGDAAWPAAAAVGVFTLAFSGLMIALIALVAGPQAIATAAAVGVLLSVGAAAMMIGAGVALAAAGISLLVGSLTKLKIADKDLVDSMLRINDTVIEKYTSLTAVFRDMASALERMAATGVLEKLATVSSVGISSVQQIAPAAKLEFAVAQGTQATGAVGQGTSVSQGSGQNAINLHIKIDSPIMLENREVGRFIDEQIKTVLANLRVPNMA